MKTNRPWARVGLTITAAVALTAAMITACGLTSENIPTAATDGSVVTSASGTASAPGVCTASTLAATPAAPTAYSTVLVTVVDAAQTAASSVTVALSGADSGTMTLTQWDTAGTFQGSYYIGGANASSIFTFSYVGTDATCQPTSQSMSVTTAAATVEACTASTLTATPAAPTANSTVSVQVVDAAQAAASWVTVTVDGTATGTTLNLYPVDASGIFQGSYLIPAETGPSRTFTFSYAGTSATCQPFAQATSVTTAAVGGCTASSLSVTPSAITYSLGFAVPFLASVTVYDPDNTATSVTVLYTAPSLAASQTLTLTRFDSTSGLYQYSQQVLGADYSGWLTISIEYEYAGRDANCIPTTNTDTIAITGS